MKQRSIVSLVFALVLLFSLGAVAPFSNTGTAVAQTPLSDLVDTAASDEDLSTFVAALQAAGLMNVLRSQGPFTLFAPTNAAFQALPEGMLEGLLADPAGDLTQILLNHVISGELVADDIDDGLTANTLRGEQVAFRVAGDTVTVHNATITTADIEASNGVMHIVDAVIMPGTEGEAIPAAEPTEEPTEEPAGEAAAETEATPEPTAEPTPESTEEPAAEPAEAAETEPEPTAVPEAEAETPEAEATAAPEQEMADATPAPSEEMAGELEEDMADDMAEGESGVPETMPVTGVRVANRAAPVAVVLTVLAILIGGSILARRRPF